MKLVDILARELKVWPEPTVPLNGGKDDCCQSDETTEVYFGFGRDSVRLSKRAENTIGVSVTRVEWQAAVDALKVAEGIADAEVGNLIPLDDVKSKCVEYSPAMHAQRAGRVTRVVAWDGEGLPPVGAVVHTAHKRKEMTVKILAYGDHHKDKCVLVADMSHGFEGKMFGWIAPMCVFRPIKTAEQIAAEEREAEISKMFDIINAAAAGGSGKAAARALYDAGYRKQVAL